jgi:uncharacterized membrane protein YkvA (DUF1232 family)
VDFLLDKIKSRARVLKNEIFAVSHASKDPRTPWQAKVLIFLIVAYALSPVDLIPDFIPVLGYLDDLIIVPLGIALAIRMISPEVLDEARRSMNQEQAPQRSVGFIGLILIAFIWILILAIVVRPILNGWLILFRGV